MGLPALYINRDARYDWLIALEHGRVCDGHSDSQFRGAGRGVAYMLDRPGGSRVIGFVVEALRAVAPPPELFGGPLFDVPLFGLAKATAGEIVLAAKARFTDESTANRKFFQAAIHAPPDDAEPLWRRCLESGDSMAHYALGYVLLGQGRARDAYGHLRYYTELAPTNAWAWCWLGQACEALGEVSDARAAYGRAMELGETDADALAAELA